MRLVAILLVVFSCVAAAKDGRARSASHAGSHGFTHGGGGRVDPRPVLPLDPKRKINEQDCSKPIDLTAGNLKCK